ncbi:hypothetical protein lam_608 [Candidatus Liberibacter americanus str. Sao Paulo]|uniref:Uncharacterized protein n=1 Tax=Candidatus Liberibacter americanus str. Sao Paulo TaxID=1261131 RepID=U6B4Y1_9HYPH|nr:hypothetical protein lam_608 [Candidatus Liberibacter americanus str. Sao Paulo]
MAILSGHKDGMFQIYRAIKMVCFKQVLQYRNLLPVYLDVFDIQPNASLVIEVGRAFNLRLIY